MRERSAGVLILKKEGRLFIEAEGEVDKDDITVLQAVPVEANPDFPTAIVHYVERTKESARLE